MLKFKRYMKNARGFTLIELLVVLVIIGILAGLAIPRIQGVRNRAYETQSMSNLRTIQTALEMHFIENNNYPAKGAEGSSGLEVLITKEYLNDGTLTIPGPEGGTYGYDLDQTGQNYTVTDSVWDLKLTPSGIEKTN